MTELCDLVQHPGGSILDHRASVHSGVQGGGQHDRAGVRVRVSQLMDEVCPGPVWESEVEDHHIGSSQTAASFAQRRCFSHDLKIGIAPELRRDGLANVALSSTRRIRTGLGLSARSIA